MRAADFGFGLRFDVWIVQTFSKQLCTDFHARFQGPNTSFQLYFQLNLVNSRPATMAITIKNALALHFIQFNSWALLGQKQTLGALQKKRGEWKGIMKNRWQGRAVIQFQATVELSCLVNFAGWVIANWILFYLLHFCVFFSFCLGKTTNQKGQTLSGF